MRNTHTHTHTHTPPPPTSPPPPHTHTEALFVAFYDMRAVTFVLPDEMTDVSIAGLQWFILTPRLNHTSSQSDSLSKPYVHQEKKKIWNKNHQPAAIL